MTQAFNLSQFANKVNTSGQASLTTAVSGTLPVANGGTGDTTYTNGQLLIGNTTGNTLTKATLTQGSGITITNGAGSITIAASGGGSLQTEVFTAPGTWTKPSSATQVRVTVIGGGGGGSNYPGFYGGCGGFAKAIVPVSAPVAITIGAGGNPGSSGGTSSFGPAVSATGGGGGASPQGTNGTGTVSVGTALRSGISINASTSNSNFLNLNDTFTQGKIPASNEGDPTTTTAWSLSNVRGSGTPGASGSTVNTTGRAGIGGTIIVEYVG
jgi:hypothetical protein